MPVERRIPSELTPHVADPIRQDVEFSPPFIFDADAASSPPDHESPPLSHTLEQELADATAPKSRHRYEIPKRLTTEGTLPYQGDGTRFSHSNKEIAPTREVTIVAFGPDADRLRREGTHTTKSPSPERTVLPSQ